MDLSNLSEAAKATAPADATAQKKPQAEPKPYEPMVRGESNYDRVTSMLMSVVIGAAIIVSWLWLVYYTNQAYAAKVPAAVVIVEVSGGGSPDGAEGATGETVDVQGATATGAVASNASSEDASAFEEPAEQQTNSPALDPLAAPANDGGEGGEVASESTTTGGAISSGPRTRAIGKGGIGIGEGGGPGSGVAREKRWLFEHPAGQGEDEYARELDSLGIELATPGGSNTLIYGSNFSSAPLQRTGLAGAEKRMYLSWSSTARKQFDVALLRKAGAKVDTSSFIIQLLPKKMEDRLAQLEVTYKGRQPAEIRRTRFKIIPAGGSFDFQVVEQIPLR